MQWASSAARRRNMTSPFRGEHMKRLAWIIAVLAILLAGYGATGPYRTVSAIKTAVVEQDAEALAEHVDFPVLRQNVKEQLNAFMAEKLVDELSDNPFAGVAAALGSRLIDTMVDAMVTPAGLARAMEGRKAARSLRDAHSDPRPRRANLFRHARYTYDSWRQCSVSVPRQQGSEIRFVFRRAGLSWKLTNILLPLDDLS